MKRLPRRPLHGSSRSRRLTTVLAIGAAVVCGALPSAAYALSESVSETWAEWNRVAVAENHWVLSATQTGLVVWNDQDGETSTSNFACGDELAPKEVAQDGIGQLALTMTQGGTLYAVVVVGTENPFVLGWEAKLGSGLPHLSTAICDALDQEYDPGHDALFREGAGESPWGKPGERGVEVLIASTDRGRSWHLAAAPRASVAPGFPENEDSAGVPLLEAVGAGVRWGNPSDGYTIFSGDGWSPVAGAGGTQGYLYGSQALGALDPETSGPRGYILTATRRLGDGAIWALWQPSWAPPPAGGGEKHLNYVAQITETLLGRVISRVTVDPGFTVANGGTAGELISPGCVGPRTGVAEGITEAMPSITGSTVYATTPGEARWVPGCHNKYISTDATIALRIVIVSHNGGKTWERVRLPNLGTAVRPGELLTVDGTQPVISFFSNHQTCTGEGGELYERLSQGHWHTIGCHDTRPES